MKILFDANMPRPFRLHLPAHTVRTTQEMGWAELANGRLMSAAEAAGFDLLLSTDHSIESQQNMKGRTISLIMRRGYSNSVNSLLPLLSELEDVMAQLEPGSVVTVGPVRTPMPRRRETE